MNTDWDKRFLELASVVGSWSKDPSTKVGAVIVNENKQIVSMGYNGFPRGVRDDYRLENRETKYNLIVHAEANAIIHAKESLEGKGQHWERGWTTQGQRSCGNPGTTL